MPRVTLNHFRSAKPGNRRRWLDRVLRPLGPSWQAAPVRRFVQLLFFVLFLLLFFYVSWPYADIFATDLFSNKEILPAESFLLLDPLVGLSAAIAARAFNIALVGTALVMIASLLVPRGFCSYVCPLGTLIDLCDGLVGRHLRPKEAVSAGWWRYLKYYLLTAAILAASFGVLLTGFVAAIPVVTRAMAFIVGPLQLGMMRNWSQVRDIGFGEWFSVALFAFILLAGVLRKRFWCRYLCPSGALFSLMASLRLTRRHVTSDCIECGKCVEACPFDAIEDDFTTRGLDCTWCQACGGACPTEAIQFAAGTRHENSKVASDSASRTLPARRGFLAAAIGGVAAAIGLRSARGDSGQSTRLIRPPGSVAEPEFLALCVRCGHCFQVCPGPVLRPAGLETSFEALWTPVADMLHAGCHQDCNFCTQVCPTGAIRPLTIEQKRQTPMGLAIVRENTCVSHTGDDFCRLCADECDAAGYSAIEMRRIELPIGEIPEGLFSDEEIDAMSHTEAPFINADKCVGCGLCEYRCHAVLVKQQKELDKAAVYVTAQA